MSSSTSYRWSLQQEQERQRRLALLAELEAQRARERALKEQQRRAIALRSEMERALKEQQRTALRSELEDLLTQERYLRNAASEHRMEISVPKLDRPAETSTVDNLKIIVAATRKALDDVEERLQTGVRRRAAENLMNSSELATFGSRATPARRHEDGNEADDQQQIARIAVAATALLVEEAPRASAQDVADLQRRCSAISGLGLPAARVALRDLAVRLTESINRRKTADAYAQLRAQLVYLAGEVAVKQRAAMRHAVAEAKDHELSEMRTVIESAVALESARRARIEVAEKLVTVLKQAGYVVGEQFVDVLHRGDEVVFASSDYVDYGLRLRMDRDRNRIHATAVRRDDAWPGADREVQEQTCADLDSAAKRLAAGGCRLELTRLDPDGKAPSMSAAYWPEREDTDSKIINPMRSEQLRTQHIQSKDSS
jgi:hypothetical protein